MRVITDPVERAREALYVELTKNPSSAARVEALVKLLEAEMGYSVTVRQLDANEEQIARLNALYEEDETGVAPMVAQA